MIGINVIVLSTVHYGQPTVLSSVQENFNYFFFGVFALEAILKISAFGIVYFKRWFNVFDFIVVFISGITIGLQVDGLTANILRVFRVLMKIMRVLRTATWAADLRRILLAIVPAFPSLGNIGVLLFLLYFVYAALGMSFFYNVRNQGYIDDLANFRSFGNAFMTLFRATTGENWNGIMHDCMRNDCIPEAQDGCGGFLVSLVFWYTFQVSTAFVVVNLFVAVILDNLGAIRRRPNLLQPERFTATWRRLDPQGLLMLHWNDLEKLMEQLPPPIGFHCCASHRFRLRKLLGLKIPVYETQLTYSDVYEHLSSAVLEAFSEQEARANDEDADDDAAASGFDTGRLAVLKARHVSRVLKRSRDLSLRAAMSPRTKRAVNLFQKGLPEAEPANAEADAAKSLLRRLSGAPHPGWF
jgi:hypothetical protein